MIAFVYDGTWEGLLTSVFEAFERKASDAIIRTEESYVPSMLDEAVHVITNESYAKRVFTGLQKRLNGPALEQLYWCFLSEKPEIETTILRYIQYAYSTSASIEKAFAHPAVFTISQVAKQVYREKHRMEAFVRFQLTSDDIFFSVVEPDFNVLPLLIKHFKGRYADQKWVIFDKRRQYGISYDLNEVTYVTFEGMPNFKAGDNSIFKEEEAIYQSLWKNYFKSVNIKERKNLDLHFRHVPKRYWKYLTEKHPEY